MARISLLDELTVNQIAAGEVVERPASVVKELVENSLDAGATRITVEITGGGRELIRVTDDGCGMDADDARRCLERHATSKIQRTDDLLNIHSFGFRGEALPSIAAVARLELVTRVADDLAGTRVQVAGGEVQAVEACGCPAGTRVEVRDLFYNTPARLRHLKTDATELARCGDVLSRLALAHPGVALRFRSGATEVFATSGRARLVDTAAAVLGAQTARELLPVDHAGRACGVTGLVGRPATSRSSRAQQYLVVNGRPVQAAALRYALEEAYRNVMPQGRYPVAILVLQVPPADLDVNVHPQKLEVRFARERDVRGDVYRAVQAALVAALVVPGAEVPGAVAPGAARPGAVVPGAVAPGAEVAAAAAREAAPRLYQPLLGSNLAGPWSGAAPTAGPGAAPPVPPPFTPGRPAGTDAWAAPEPVVPTSPAEVVASLRPLGQVQRSYIACDGPGGLYLVDQHAAHERVYFEKFLAEAESAPVAVQPLLFPATVELGAAHLGLWQESAPLFTECGLEAEAFGGRTLLIKAIPAGISERWAGRLVQEFLDRLQADGGLEGGPVDRRRRALAALAACKAAIKANDPLGAEEIAALLRDLAACHHPGQCPHGRPTVILVGMPELEKRFGRK